MIHLASWVVLLMLIQDGPLVQGDGSIRGRVTDAETGEPIPHALVHIRRIAPIQDLQTIAAADGTYAFTGLRPAAYEVRAAAGEHLSSHIPKGYSSRPDETGVTPIQLGAGQVRTGIDIALRRPRAISGRVVDDNGEPVAGVSVQLLRSAKGEPVLPGGLTPQTDDLGAFRMFFLEPGTYFVCATVLASTRFSEHIAGARPLRPVTTCHPSAEDSPGRAVNVATADAEGIEIRMRLQPVVTISGQVFDASGAPARGAQVSLFQSSNFGGTGGGVSLAEDGRFRISELSRGTYTVSANIGGSGPKPAPDFQWAAVDLDIDSVDIEGVVLTLRPSARVKGQIIYEDGAPEEMTAVQIQTDPVGMRGAPRLLPVTADSRGRFELVGVAGPQVVGLRSLPAGWLVKSVRYRGADITDVPAEFRSGQDEIEIVLTSRIATVGGRVFDARGNPAASGRVVLIPADGARARARAARVSASIRADGTFTLPPRPAGDYRVFALSKQDYDALDDDVAAQMQQPGERITLREHERRTLDLKLTPLPPVR